MNNYIELKFKTKSGQICTIQVDELLTIDGKAYRDSSNDYQELRETLILHQGQIDTILSLLAVREATNDTAD